MDTQPMDGAEPRLRRPATRTGAGQRSPRPVGVSDGDVQLVLDDTDASWRAMRWAVEEAVRLDRPVSAVVVQRRCWWDGIGTTAMIPGGDAALRQSLDELRLEYGLVLVAHGHDMPVSLASVGQVCDLALRRGAPVVVTPAHLGRRISRKAAKRGIAVVMVP